MFWMCREGWGGSKAPGRSQLGEAGAGVAEHEPNAARAQRGKERQLPAVSGPSFYFAPRSHANVVGSRCRWRDHAPLAAKYRTPDSYDSAPSRDSSPPTPASIERGASRSAGGEKEEGLEESLSHARWGYPRPDFTALV